ncbi:hypothetical protein KP509_24G052800 [Ceratopteris richardii]|uniref:Chitin-binding type-4 domain-containing protein n=1 Tax=Ceratopteris richardii TaxID=49495 RepID=A0A8T2RXV6_CERRI|nr:hypothetical protein KP509_1Z115600 [Ceratopteris richardii]KAH7300243.1 hypothetical protein KP509_24G052800 [Ceratopteris richardii]
MTNWRTLAFILLLSNSFLSRARGHGAMGDTIARVYACYLENPENPRSEACKAAVALSGAQAFYDWNEVNIADAAGRHRELIPDGQLCSAGREKYKGLDLPRADWTATALTSSAEYLFLYRVTAPHVGFFEFYVTRDSYDPTEPLKWSDLEDTPFLNVTNPAIDSANYRIPGVTPAGKSGRHLIYVIWQRSDSPEAFYSCCDVHFGEGASRHSLA